MKGIIIPAFLILTLASCEKEKVKEQVSTSADHQIIGQDSIANTLKDSANTSVKNALTVEPIDFNVDLGKAIFTVNGKVLIGFDSTSNEGKIKINGKTYKLNKYTFAENGFEMKGEAITITGSNGNFEEMVSDCAYGTYPEVKVNLNGQETILKNVKVQDCPNYN